MALTEATLKNAKHADRAYKPANGVGMFLLVKPNGTAGLGWSFSSRPRLGSMPVYGEMLVRKQRRHRLVRLDRRQELAGDVGGQQSVAVSAEYGRHLHRICSSDPRIFAP
jgi:hypothetical protein